MGVLRRKQTIGAIQFESDDEEVGRSGQKKLAAEAPSGHKVDLDSGPMEQRSPFRDGSNPWKRGDLDTLPEDSEEEEKSDRKCRQVSICCGRGSLRGTTSWLA